MARSCRRIMVAVDEGEESLYALSWCLKNIVATPSPATEAGAGDEKDTLVLLYVRPSRVVYGAMDGTGYLFSSDIVETMDRYRNELANSVMERAKRVCDAFGDQVKLETIVGNGDAREVICEMVEREGADMLVVGSHGYGMIKRALLGSVSNHCAQNVRCPVLIVKRPKH